MATWAAFEAAAPDVAADGLALLTQFGPGLGFLATVLSRLVVRPVKDMTTAMAKLASGDVTVTGSAGGPYTVTFGGTLDLSALAIMTATDALTGGTTPAVDIETTTQFLLRDGSTVGFTQTYGAVAGSRTGSIIE